MCRSDSGADTRYSENTFPASLADEREREGVERKHTGTERCRKEWRKKVKDRQKEG